MPLLVVFPQLLVVFHSLLVVFSGLLVVFAVATIKSMKDDQPNKKALGNPSAF
ncbi:hypothetical protein [Planococcus shenhongbingii]|uniref:Uncharacterized protein n=1 Tax=Planococcus shenhongbingii TaxID=3058398 RepID=A0ABT8NE92_9BACL|nr:hypothetical protein [Planococcus sp. N017]MDN7246221.1 hypothetical protein [Planococcus sp. N017]